MLGGLPTRLHVSPTSSIPRKCYIPLNVRNLCPQRSFRYRVFTGGQMILKRRFKLDRRRRKRQLLNTSVQVFTESAQLDGLGINLSDVGMCLFTMANLQVGSACACLPWPISKWDLRFRSNFSRPEARNLSEFPGLFAIAPCIYTESIFWWIQINTQVIGQT